MFMLFVFPNPVGPVFTLLRLLVIGLAGYLFVNLYGMVKDRERPKSVVSAPGGSQEATELRPGFLDGQQKTNLKKSVKSILELFTSTFPEFSASVYLVDTSGKELVQLTHSGDRNYLRCSFSLEDSTIKDVLGCSRPEFITLHEGSEVLSGLFDDDAEIPPSTTVLASPITTDGVTRGLLLIEGEQFADFEENHRLMAELYVHLIATELERFDSHSELVSNSVFFSHLEAFQNRLDIDRPEDEFISAVTRFCEKRFPFDKLTFSLVDEDQPNEAIVLDVLGFDRDIGPDGRYSLENTLHGRLILEGKPLLIDNLAEYPDVGGRFAKGDILQYNFLSFVGVPLKNKDGIIGSLALESFASRKYSMADLSLLQTVGERVGSLLKWWKDYGIVKETARRDGLTGLLNHRSFMERFEEEISRANRYQENLVLLVLDLDKFKRINDNHGHLYGDYVLRETANTLRWSVRSIDLVARYGGEEFAIVLINATKQGVLHTTRRIVENVAAHKFEKDGISERMTISAGAAEFPSDGTTPKGLIARADEAMYDVKRKGGNGVLLAATDFS